MNTCESRCLGHGNSLAFNWMWSQRELVPRRIEQAMEPLNEKNSEYLLLKLPESLQITSIEPVLMEAEQL